MSPEENKALMRRAYEAANQRDLTTFFELFTPDVVFHQASLTIQGLDAFKQLQAMYIAAFPDFHFTVEDMIADQDTVTIRNTVSGTHQGVFMNLPPTGKHWTISQLAFSRVEGDKIAEYWDAPDMLGLMHQLGVLPLPEQLGQQQVMLSNPDNGEPQTSPEENKALVRRTYEAVNQGDLTTFFELFTPDFVLRNGSMTIQGLEAFKQIETMLLTALPDLHYTVEDLIADQDKVAVRVTATGTHQGMFLDIPPTGKHTTVTEAALSRIVGGKIAEHWSETDLLGLLHQLGALPAPDQAVTKE